MAGPEAETMEEHFLLTFSLGSHSAPFLTPPRTTGPGLTLPTVGWAPPHNHQSRKCPITLPIDDSSLYQVDSSKIAKTGSVSCFDTYLFLITGI